ncbi:MAG: hypothetical protein R3E12_13150 [Candidatus Eisenbacteria bacterium]
MIRVQLIEVGALGALAVEEVDERDARDALLEEGIHRGQLDPHDRVGAAHLGAEDHASR